MLRMADLIEKIESYRLEKRLSKAAMARELGANTRQQYSAWLSRGSLPKQYYEAAANLLGEPIAGIAPAPPENRPLSGSLFSRLSNDQKMDVMLSLVDEIGEEERARLLAKLLGG